MIGQTISHYRILEKLGEGGMGVVYKAEDTRLGRTVALKFLPDRPAPPSSGPHGSSPQADRDCFLQEARAASLLNHPNVCTIHDIQEHEGQTFIVMEFVDGMTLRRRLATPLPLKSTIDIGIQLAEGLAAAHEKGIVHRDMKPENIMIRRDGIAQIMDFGLAKLQGVSRLTREGSTVGTAGNMSPEQVQGHDVDHRSDIFSLGVILYEMIAGRAPFSAVHESAMMYEIVNVEPPLIQALKTDVDPAMNYVRGWSTFTSAYDGVVKSAPLPYARVSGYGNALDGGMKFDLDTWDEAFFTRLYDTVSTLQANNIYYIYVF